MKKLITISTLALMIACPAFAQGVAVPRGPATTGTIIQGQPNTTGNVQDVIIAPGATGADTITTNSAAGGNASRPERAIPNGSANGGGNSEGP
jgi:hypothetical protein